MSNRGRPIGYRKSGGRQPGQWKLLTAEKLREFRKEHRISRARLAKMLGVSTTSIQNWDGGRFPPSLKYQARLVEIMANPPIGDNARHRTDAAAMVTSGAVTEIEVTGQIMAAWLQSNPKVRVEDVGKVVSGIRQALRA